MISSGKALFTTLKLRSEGLVPATAALRTSVTSTPSSSARQTFPSGILPAVKDCFGLHGHSAFGSVAKRQIGVGRLSATSGGQTTDLVHWLQVGKTVDILRYAVESTDLLPPSALPRSLRSLRLFSPSHPAAGRLPAPLVIVLPLWMLLILMRLVMLSALAKRSASTSVVVYLLVLLLYMEDRDNCTFTSYIIVIVLLGVMRLLMISA